MIRKFVIAIALTAGLSACVAEDFMAAWQSGTAAPVKEESPVPPEVVTAADWSRAEIRVLTIRQGEFTPAILSFRSGVPYVLRIENRDDSGRTLSAGEFFEAIAVKSLSPAGEDFPEGTVLSSIDLEPMQTRELAFVPLRDGYYPITGAFLLQYLGGPTGAILID